MTARTPSYCSCWKNSHAWVKLGVVTDITVGTFNLNNLFSRYNFEAKVDDIPEDERDVAVFYDFVGELDHLTIAEAFACQLPAERPPNGRSPACGPRQKSPKIVVCNRP